jgi:hypothetical protein
MTHYSKNREQRGQTQGTSRCYECNTLFFREPDLLAHRYGSYVEGRKCLSHQAMLKRGFTEMGMGWRAPLK